MQPPTYGFFPGGSKTFKKVTSKKGHLSNLFYILCGHYDEKNGTSFPSFTRKNPVKFDICNFFSAKQQRRHCDVIHGMFVLFRYVWKEETHSYNMVPNKQISRCLFFKFTRELQEPTLDRRFKIAWLDKG